MLNRFFLPKAWPIWAIIASILMLGAAHAFERFALLAPCPLCLRQREVYWAAILLAVIGLVLIRWIKGPRLVMTVNVLLGLVFVTGAVIAGYHAGVEWGLWPGPTACSGTGGEGLALDAASMNLNRGFATVSCSEAAWRMFGISMAGYNAVISLGLAIASGISARRALAKKHSATTSTL